MSHKPGPCFLDHTHQTWSVAIGRCLRKDSAFLTKWIQPEVQLGVIPEENSGSNLRPLIMALTTVENSVVLHLCVVMSIDVRHVMTQGPSQEQMGFIDQPLSPQNLFIAGTSIIKHFHACALPGLAISGSM